MKKIFIKTTKADHMGSEFSPDIKRTLSYINGKTSSAELAKRAPPSLRKRWSDLVSQLVDGGYIVEVHKADTKRQAVVREVKPLVNGDDLDSANLPSHHPQVATEHTLQLEKEIAQASAYQYAVEFEKIKSEAEMMAEAKQAELDAARVHAEQQAAVESAKSEPEAMIKAEANQNNEQAALVEIEEVVPAHLSPVGLDIKDMQEESIVMPNAAADIYVVDDEARRLQDLEIENSSLKQLLVEAYMEINSLKAALEAKDSHTVQ